MIKRPICAGALILTAVLLWNRQFGVSETVPRSPSGEDRTVSSSDRSAAREGSTVRILGQAAAMEETAGGIRLYLRNYSILEETEAETRRFARTDGLSAEKKEVAEVTAKEDGTLAMSGEQAERSEVFVAAGGQPEISAALKTVVLSRECINSYQTISKAIHHKKNQAISEAVHLSQFQISHKFKYHLLFPLSYGLLENIYRKTAGILFTADENTLDRSEVDKNTVDRRITAGKNDRIMVYLKEEPEGEIPIGSWITVRGIYYLPNMARNPGQFDSREYYRPRGIVCVMKKAEILRRWPGKEAYTDLLARIREMLRDSMNSVMGQEDAALVCAITLGERGMLSGEVKRLYQEGGIAHILAISSLHMTMLGMGLYRLLRRTGCPIWLSAVLSAVFLFSFCIMTGSSVSAVRACTMFFLWLGSQVWGRTCDQPTSLALAGILILLGSPYYLSDSSFCLSFGCILSLHFLTPLMKKLLPLQSGLGSALQSSLALQTGTLPLTMYFFYQITPYSFLVNLLVLPFMEVLMLSGLLSGVLGLFSLSLGTLASAPCHYLLKIFALLCSWERKLPGAVLITGRPGLRQVLVYYGLLIFLVWLVEDGEKVSLVFKRRWMKYGAKPGAQIPRIKLAVKAEWSVSEKAIAGKGTWNRKQLQKEKWRKGLRMVIAGWAFLGILTAILLLRIRPRLRITFLDVGQGDGILVEAGDFTCMIDGGSSSEDQVWQYRIESTLKYYGISRLNAAFISHGDQDHISGVQELLEEYEKNDWGVNVGGITLDCLMLPELDREDEHLQELEKAAGEQGIEVRTCRVGEGAAWKDGTLTCLSPAPENCTGDANEDSMVLLLEQGKFRSLFTGDLEGEGEERLQQSLGSLPVTLLKVGHHGSKNATGEALLEALQPKLAVISCGENNRYGHPTAEVLERLEKSGAEIYRTDRQGAVTVTVKREKVLVSTFLEE